MKTNQILKVKIKNNKINKLKLLNHQNKKNIPNFFKNIQEKI